MSTIPENETTLQDLFDWYVLQEDLKKVKAREMLLRQKLFKHHFPTPEEGTNSLSLDPVLIAAGLAADGRMLKGGYVINREVDAASLNVLGPKFAENGIKVQDLIQWKPSLKTGEYRKLTAEQLQLFDQCLIIKPGSPTLEVVLPKARGKAGEKAQ